MQIVDKPFRYFITVDDRNVPVSYQMEFQRRIDDGTGGDVTPAVVMVKDISAMDFNAVYSNASVALTGDVADAHAQIATLKDASGVLQAKHDALVNLYNTLKLHVAKLMVVAQQVFTDTNNPV